MLTVRKDAWKVVGIVGSCTFGFYGSENDYRPHFLECQCLLVLQGNTEDSFLLF